MKSYPYLLFLILPFGISASIEFLPTWVAYPSAIIQSLFWLGSFAMIVNKDTNENS